MNVHRNSRISFAVILLLLTSMSLFGQTDPRTLYSNGVESLAMDDPYAAVDSFRSAIRLNPAYADARLGMAEALFLLSEYEDAFTEIEEARNYAAGRRDLILLEARILTALRRYDEAENLYSNLLAGRPHDGDANRGLAEIFALKGQRELAEEAFDLSLRYSPGDRRALLQLVILHDEAREQEASDAAILEALRIFPDSLEVRMQAAEHYALYEQWESATDHLDRARAMVEIGDNRYRRVGMLDAELSLRMGDPASALVILEMLDNRNSTDILYLMAMANRQVGNEEQSQNLVNRLLRIDSEDEIARMFREETLFSSAEGYDEYRATAAAWHLVNGLRFENDFRYHRAYSSYRRARLLSKFDPEVWIAYTNMIRKMGYPEHYADSLIVALENIPESMPQYSAMKRSLELLEHSSEGSLSESWNIPNPWAAETSTWDMGIYISENDNSLPIHPESQLTLGLYFADVIDTYASISVPYNLTGTTPEIKTVNTFPEAFRASRGEHDYFAILRFAETNRTFGASCEVYLSRSGELLGRYEELRTGQGRVSDTLFGLADAVAAGIPEIMSVIGIDGPKVLFDKGRWHGIEAEKSWIIVRGGSARPTVSEGGLEFSSEDYLGKVEITALSEPLSEGIYTRSGDFDFIRLGDSVYQLPEPEDTENTRTAPDPAFRARLLAIP